MKRRRLQQRQIVVEQLEPRSMLNGDVSITVTNGDLILRSDSDDINLEIGPGATQNSWLITPLDGTTANNRTDPLIVTGINDDVIIDMRGARHSVWIHDLNIAGELSVLFEGKENSDERMLLNSLRVQSYARIHTARGNDSVQIIDSIFEQYISIGTGKGNDFV